MYTCRAAAGNLIQGNYLGANQAGTGAMANGQDGVVIQDGASTNTITGPMASRQFISATARDPNNNTSEFSVDIQVQ